MQPSESETVKGFDFTYQWTIRARVSLSLCVPMISRIGQRERERPHARAALTD